MRQARKDGGVKSEKKKGKSKRPGLWANIRAKRKRIKAGSGERMRKPGSKIAPSKRILDKQELLLKNEAEVA